ncbi:MAG TPA: sugar porter family MFS transporter [Candidatus Fraserbacteria bacterium]|nr:sugar porter family MFS transporter [Candidatus Fraserbacteria bacterium]
MTPIDTPHSGAEGKETKLAKKDRFVYVAAFFAALGGLLFGYDTGVISGAILFVKQQFALTPGMEGVVVSAVLAGAVIGAIAGGPLSDRYGRRPVIIAAAILFALGAAGTALAPGVYLLIAGRVVVGVAIGVASLIAPMYIAEIAPHKIRGSLVALNQLALTVGIVISYLVDYALAGAHAWRWMFALAAIPALILGIGMLFLPESPRWLVSHALIERARTALKRVRGESKEQTEREISEIQTSLGQQTGGWAELLSAKVRPGLLIGMLLALFQQITGINTVIYYAPTIFQFAGFKSASAAILATIGVGVVNVVFTVVAVRLLDKTGRRPLLLVGLVGMVLSLTVLGWAFLSQSISGSLGLVAAASLAVYIASFAIGLGPVFWLLISEVYPLKVRGLGMGLATLVNWGSNLVVALTFLDLIQSLGRAGTFWLYAVMGVAAWLFSYLYVPETKGKTLEEIEEHWRAGRHPRELNRTT